MAERTNAPERNWQSGRQEERGRRESGEPMRELQRGREGYREGYREGGGPGGGYQPSSYEQSGARGGYVGGWQSAGPSDYVEAGYYGQGERGGYGRPPGFRHQGPGYGASSGYQAELEGGEWAAREFRPGAHGMRGREMTGPRGGPWGGQWRGEGQWEQDRDFGDEGGWGGGAGFRGHGGGFPGQGRGGGFTRWQGEGWRGGGAPTYTGGWRRGPEWGWPGPGAGPIGYGAEPGWADPARGYGAPLRPGWSGEPADWEPAVPWGGRRREWGEPADWEPAVPWGGRRREWGEPGSGTLGAAYGEPWNVPGPFTGRGPEGYQRSGDSIRDDVCERLTRHGQIDASSIRVRVEQSEVVLEGSVADRRTKRLAEDVAESVSGVRDVQNRLRVSEREEDPHGIMRGDERAERTTRESGQSGGRGRGSPGEETRGGRPERDAERQKATPRSKS